MASGSYNNKFRIFGCSNGVELSLDASRDPLRKRMQTPPKVRGVDCLGQHPCVLLVLLCPGRPVHSKWAWLVAGVSSTPAAGGWL